MSRVRRRGSGQPRLGVHTEALVVAWWKGDDKKRPYLAAELPNKGVSC